MTCQLESLTTCEDLAQNIVHLKSVFVTVLYKQKHNFQDEYVIMIFECLLDCRGWTISLADGGHIYEGEGSSYVSDLLAEIDLSPSLLSRGASASILVSNDENNHAHSNSIGQ